MTDYKDLWVGMIVQHVLSSDKVGYIIAFDGTQSQPQPVVRWDGETKGVTVPVNRIRPVSVQSGKGQ